MRRDVSSRRIAVALFALASALAVLGPAARAAPLADEKTVLINDNSWPPFFFGGQPGEPLGFGREVLERCVPKAGYRPVFRNLPVPRMLASLQSGELDVNLFSRRAEREAAVVYGAQPVFTASYRPIVRADDPIEIRAFSDLDGRLLGHLRGLTYSESFLAYLESRRAAGGVREVDTNGLLLDLLLAHKIDVYVNHDATTRWMARERGIESQVRVVPFDVKTSDYFVALSRSSPRVSDGAAFLAAIDACLVEGRKDGWIGALETRYGVR